MEEVKRERERSQGGRETQAREERTGRKAFPDLNHESRIQHALRETDDEDVKHIFATIASND